MIFLVIFAILCDIAVCAEVPANYSYDECARHKNECVYHLTVQEKLTMMNGFTFLRAEGGKLYQYNESYLNATTNVMIVLFYLYNLFHIGVICNAIRKTSFTTFLCI